MSTIVLRSVKGTPLSNTEVDTNFSNLNTDKLEAATTATLTNKTINLTSNTLVATSAQLAAAVTDETGTGALVFATSPTLVTPALGTPASGVVTNLTGTASININGTVGATTATTGAFTDVTTSGTVTLNGGTANGVAYLNGSKVLTTGSALTFDGTNLGVGIASPSGQLHVANTGTAGTTADNLSVYFSSTNRNSNVYIRAKNTDGSILNFADGDSDVVGRIAYEHSDNTMRFSANGSERMRLDSAGNVGIGTSSPTSKLHVENAGAAAAAARFTGSSNTSLVLNTTGSAGSVGVYHQYQRSGTTKFNVGLGPISGQDVFEIGNASTAFVTLNASGNLGIGTGAPDANLTVNGAASFAAGTAAAPSIARAGDLNTGIFFPAADTIAFSEGGAEAMRIDSSGNLGLGVTPVSQNGKVFHIDGGAGAADIRLTNNATGSAINNGGLLTLSGSDIYLWNLENNILSFGTNNAERARITSGGDFGIGTSSPAYKLDVAGIIRTSGTGYSSAGSPTLFLRNTTASTGRTYGLNSTDNGILQIADETAGGASRVLLDSSGNLGLGVTPSAWQSGFKAIQLSGLACWNVDGSTAGSATYFGNNVYRDSVDSRWEYLVTGDNATQYLQASGQHIWRISPSGTAGDAISFTQAMTLDASGNLGLGVTSIPGGSRRVLQISSSTNGGILLLNDNATENQNPRIFGTVTNATDLGLAAGGSTGFINFYTNNTEHARITSGGDLCVGTTSSSGKLTVESASTTATVGYVQSSTASFTGSNLASLSYTASGTGWNHLICYSNIGGTTNLKILGNGNVENANNSYGAISDAKLKENVTDATPKLDKLNQVRIVNFNMIGDEQKQLGVIAQELEQVFPGMVDESPDRDKEGNDLGTTTKSVKYSVFVPMLIKAMQEQQAIIEQLKARLDAANL